MFKKFLILAGLACGLGLAYLAFAPSGGGTRDRDSGLILALPNQTLQTNPQKQSETILFDQSKWSDFLNPFAVTGAKFEIEANYRYEIKLKNTWNIFFDRSRAIVFVIMPELQPVAPVEFEIVKDKKVVAGFDVDSKWFVKSGWDDFGEIRKQLEMLQRLNAELVKRAEEPSRIASRMSEARLLVESHLREWLVSEGHCKKDENPIVKVFTLEEAGGFPVPEGRTIGDFTP
jgi:hypothetical protein